MNFLRLSDDLLSILYEDDDIIAIDKPYGFNAHTNDAKAEHGDAIQDGLIEIYEKQREQKLHIVHRLDQTTTGVMIFGKSVEAKKKYADFFLNRQVKKTYWFVTGEKSNKIQFAIDKVIIHKAKELEAQTDFNLLKSGNGFHLWQANPFTGRNHQIRIHAQAAGISLLGDIKYGGKPFSFLCLHNHKIAFPNGVAISSTAPVYFENLDWLADPLLSKIFFEIDRRHRFYKNNLQQSFRLVHKLNAAKDPGYVLDQMGSTLILNWFRPLWAPTDEKIWTFIARQLQKTIWIQHQDSKIFIGQDNLKKNTWDAKEGTAVYELHSESLTAPGLNLNQRIHRKWLRENAKDATVLALFSNSGGYGVSAAQGGAKEIVMVESSKKQLAWSKSNFLKNGLNPDDFKFLCRDSPSFLDSTLLKGNKFDIIAVEIPTFYRLEKGVFKIEKHLPKFLSDSLSLLKEYGRLLLSIPYEGYFIDDIKKLINRSQKELGISNLKTSVILPSLDFELPEEKTNLKSFLIQKI